MDYQSSIMPEIQDNSHHGTTPGDLRRQADAMERCARHLRETAAALEATARPSLTPLTGRVAEVADFISKHPRRTGEEICKAVNCPVATFRTHYVPVLKLHGFRAERGGGYVSPRHRATST